MPILDTSALSPARRGMAAKAAAGGIVSTVPVGYRIVGRGSSAQAEIDELASPFVLRAFELAAKSGSSLRGLLASLRSSGMPGKRGGPVSLSTLQRILTNPFYMGVVRSPLTGKNIVGQHTPIVTKELFNRVQLNLRRRRCS